MILEPRDLEHLSGRIAIDIENDPAANFKATPGLLLGVGVCSPDNDLFGYVPTPDLETEQAVKRAVRTWKPGSWLIAHNIKYELQWLGFDPERVYSYNLLDTMVAEHLLAEEAALDLGSVEARRLHRRSKKMLLEHIQTEHGLKMKDIAKWPLELISEYCENDCRITYEIAQRQAPRLRSERLERLLMRAMDFTRVLYRAERYGMLVDRERAGLLAQRVRELTTQGMQRIADLAGRDVASLPNLASPKQLSTFLYEELGIKRPRLPPELASSPKAKQYQTSTGTGKAIMAQLDHPVARAILDVRQIGKLKSYLDSYRRLGEEVAEGWIQHTNFNQTGTVTGRLSSSGPNLQQVTARGVGEALLQPGEPGLYLRHVFTAREGHKIVGIDYQQMEVVGFGILSGERTMLKLIRRGGDMHEQVAHLMFGDYDPQKRKVVKTLNFGLLYGLGDAGMAEMMGLPLEDTRVLKSQYLAKFSGIRPWMERTNQQLQQNGFVRYWSGRKRRIHDSAYFYRGVNALVQGGCADVLMEAGCRVDDYLREVGVGHILAFVHDEIVFELPTDSIKELVPRIREIMSVPDLLGVPLGTDVSIGQVWDEAAY